MENEKYNSGKIKVKFVYAGRSKPIPLENLEDEILDWDAHIENPPKPHYSGAIKGRFKYVGKSKPIPLEDPWA